MNNIGILENCINKISKQLIEARIERTRINDQLKHEDSKKKSLEFLLEEIEEDILFLENKEARCILYRNYVNKN